MSATNLVTAQAELLNFLRSGDVFGASSVAIRGVTTQTDSFTATNNQTVYNLSQKNVRNIRTVTVQGTSLQYLKGYTFSTSMSATNTVTLNTGASTGNSVQIVYDYGAQGNEKIFPDWPRDDLTHGSFPRIGFIVLAGTTEPFTLGATSHISEIVFSVDVVTAVNYDSTLTNQWYGTTNLNTSVQLIRQLILTNCANFYSFAYIYPVNISTVTVSANNKLLQQTIDLKAKFIIE